MVGLWIVSETIFACFRFLKRPSDGFAISQLALLVAMAAFVLFFQHAPRRFPFNRCFMIGYGIRSHSSLLEFECRTDAVMKCQRLESFHPLQYFVLLELCCSFLLQGLRPFFILHLVRQWYFRSYQVVVMGSGCQYFWIVAMVSWVPSEVDRW